jgi:hypothetical protein
MSPGRTGRLTEYAPSLDAEATRWYVYSPGFRALQWTFVSFGVGCLAGAVAIAAYTVFGATQPCSRTAEDSPPMLCPSKSVMALPM